MRWLCFVFVAAACGNLVRVPRTGPSPFARPMHLFEHYDRDMPMPFLSLCGNGRLDTKADYEAIGTVTVGSNNINILVDEECDDGNRRDGDGCSADCMDVDALVEPCKVNVPPDVRAVAIDQVTGHTYIATPSNVAELNVTTTGITLTPIIDIAVDSMMVFNNTFYLFHMGQLSIRSDAQVMTTLKVFGTNSGTWIIFRDIYYFLTHNADTLWIFNSQTRVTRDFPASIGTNTWTECHSDKDQSNILCSTPSGDYEINIDSGIRFNAYTPASDSLNENTRAFFTMMMATATQVFFPSKSPQVLSSTISNLFQKLSKSKEVLISPFMFGVQKSNIRSILNPTVFGIFETRPVQIIGNQAFSNLTRSVDFNCYEGETCFLDTPLDGDIFGTRSTTTYFQALQSLIQQNPLTAFDKFFTTIREKLYFPTSVVRHPKTQHFLILHRGMLIFVGRRGANIKLDDGTCIPWEVKVCPTGQYGDIDAACTPCSTESNSLARHFQCKAPVSAARRRLLSEDEILVTTSIDAPDSLLQAAFPQATVQDGTVSKMTADPRQVLQSFSAVIAANPQWIILKKPVAIYRESKPTESTAESIVPLIIGICIACVAGLGLIVFGGYKVYERYSSAGIHMATYNSRFTLTDGRPTIAYKLMVP